MAHRDETRAALAQAHACADDPQRVVALLTPLISATTTPFIDLVDDLKARIALASAYDTLGLPTLRLAVLEDPLRAVEVACICGILASEVACIYYKDLGVAIAEADSTRGDQARKMAEKAYQHAQSNPEHMGYDIMMSLTFHAQGTIELTIGSDYEKAMQFFLRAEECCTLPTSRFHLKIISCAKSMLRFDILMTRAKQMWNEDPEEREQRRGHAVVMGDAYDCLGEYESALVWWRRAYAMARSAVDITDFTDDDCETAISVLTSMVSHPRRITLLQSKYRMCRRCEVVAVGLATCSRCRCAWYCNKECSVADWTSHKKICRVRE